MAKKLIDSVVIGEDIPVDIVITANGSPVEFIDMTEVVVTVMDRVNNVVTKTKTGTTVLEGSTSNSIAFTILATETQGFIPGRLKCIVALTVPSATPDNPKFKFILTELQDNVF